MDENKRSNPAELANQRLQELETAKATKQLNDAMSQLSKGSKEDVATKDDMFKAMREMTKQVKLTESKQIDAITSAAIQTALDVSLQMKSLDDPRLRRQAMITLKTINDSIKLSGDSSTNNVDDGAVKRNLTVAIDNLKTESLLSRIADKMSGQQGVVGNTMDDAGPIFGLIKDAVKGVAERIKAKQPPKPEVAFLDHQLVRPLDQPKPVPVPQIDIPRIMPPTNANQLVEKSQPQRALPMPVESSAPSLVTHMPEPAVSVDFQMLSDTIISMKETDEKILEHIESIAAVMKEQLIMSQDEREKDNAKDIGHNFRKYKPVATPATAQQPSVQNGDTSGGILDFITPLLFGAKGLMGTVMKFVIRMGVAVLGMLNPKNILKFAKGVYDSIIRVGSQVFGKLGSIFDDLGGVLGKFGNLGKLTKGIPIIGQVIAVVMGIFDFFSSFMHADEVLGKSKEAITLWDRVSAGIGGFIGGIVGIADALLSVFGIDTDMGGFVKETVAKYLADIPNVIIARFAMLVDLKNTIANGIQTAVDKIKGGMEIVSGFLDDVSDFISNLGPTLKKMFTEKAREILNMLPGNLGDKLLPAGDGKKVEEPKKDAEQPKQQEKPEEQNFIQRAVSKLPSLGDIFGSKEEKATKEREAERLQAQQASHSNTNNINNVSSSNTNIYQSNPISTRPSDDSFRILI